MLRDKNGRFIKGNEGFWLGKERESMKGKSNWRWSGGLFERKCLVCGEIYSVQKNRLNKTKYCSISCGSRWKFTGERNPLWKGGIPREQRTELPEYEVWRKEVYKKDWYGCRICGYKGRLLVAHHIKSFKDFPELRFEISNGLTLCRGCHCKLHTLYKKVIDFTVILRDFTSETERSR